MNHVATAASAVPPSEARRNIPNNGFDLDCVGRTLLSVALDFVLV
jgi:hypothetical protein